MIKDSGNRRQFDSGAVRDIQTGKGRCDLLPLDVIAELCHGNILRLIHRFTLDGDVGYLYEVLVEIMPKFGCYSNMLLEVSIHFEEGANKYGDYNWQKGIPAHCYIDSALRHFFKWVRNDDDEPHDRAFVWNIMCCIWTCQHIPELNDYAKGGDKS